MNTYIIIINPYKGFRKDRKVGRIALLNLTRVLERIDREAQSRSQARLGFDTIRNTRKIRFVAWERVYKRVTRTY